MKKDQSLVLLEKQLENITIELEVYLKEHEYDSEIKMFFYEAFKRIYYAYYALDAETFNSIESDVFAQSILNTLKKVDKVNFIRDINKDNYLADNVIVLDRLTKSTIGYIKDEEGHYQISSNPKYWPSVSGYAEIGGKSVNILYDDVSLADGKSIYAIFFHELIHTEQIFNLYLYIINLNLFHKVLTEGHAIMTVRKFKKIGSDICSIPLLIGAEGNKFQIGGKDMYYRLYRYIYFKFEFILGKKFMNEWAGTRNGEHYLELAYKKIDDTYGRGTFERLYTNIQLILTAFREYNGESPIDEIENKNQVTIIDNNDYVDMINKKYNKLGALLDNETAFNKKYQAKKNDITVAIEVAKKFKMNTTILETKLNNFTKKAYRKICNEEFSELKCEIQVYNNIDFFKMLTAYHQHIFSIIKNNSEYLTESVIDLESLMMDCLESIKTKKDRDDMFDYYDYNVFSNKFYSSIMYEVKKKYDTINYRKEDSKDTVFSSLHSLDILAKKIVETTGPTKTKKKK